jgi:hypothetical protein
VQVETTNTLATLFNNGSRLTLNIVDRHLEANNAYTVWWMIFNDRAVASTAAVAPILSLSLGPPT